MIKLGKNVMMFAILTLGGVYFLYEDLRKLFNPVLQDSKDVDLALDESTQGYSGRKLSTLDPTVNEELLELKPDLVNKGELNNEENAGRLISYKKFGRNRMKKLSRRKRSAHHNDFGWKISLNVTNNQNSPKGVTKVKSEEGLLSKSGKEKFLNMAVQMEGSSPDKSLKEFHEVWDSLGLFLKSLYVENVSLKENAGDPTVEIITKPNDILLSNIPTEKAEKERSPKFISFGLFGSNSNPPIEEVGTLVNGDSSESVTSPKTNVAPKEGHISTIVPFSAIDTEASIEAFDLPELISLEPSTVPITETFMDFEGTSSEFTTQFLEKFEKTSAIPDSFPIKISTIKPVPSFTSDQLKEFCISLLSRIHNSHKSADSFSEEDGSGELNGMNMEDKETVIGVQSLSTDVPKEVTKSTNQRFGIWASIWNRFVGRSLVQHPIDVSLQPSTSTPKHITFEKAKDSSTDAFSLKDESSSALDNSDSTESDFFSDEEGSALNVPDCEHFFRQMQHDAIFSKPNLLDIINNPILLNLEPSQFNFTEGRDDKQMRSMRAGSHSTDSNFESDLVTEEMVNSLNTPLSNAKSTAKEHIDEFSVNELSEQPDKNLFDITVSNKDPLSTPSSIDAQESLQSGTFDTFNIGNLITKNGKDSRKSATEIAFLSDKFTTIQTRSSTGIMELDEGLFIQTNVRERTDKSTKMPSLEISSDINERIFGLLGFGSGERNLEDSDSVSTQDVSEFIENRSSHPDLINFPSSDSKLNEATSVSGLEITSEDSVSRPNIFDVILSMQKEESLMNSTESDAFVINEGNQPTEGESTIPSVKKPLIELQFDPKEKPTEMQNVLDQTNINETQLMPVDRTPFQDVFNEKPRIELHFDPEEKFTETQNVVLVSTNIPVIKSLSEDQIPFQKVLDDESDEGSMIFPGLNVFGSGDGRESPEITTDPEIKSEFSECLDCFKNISSSFSVDECINCGSDVNDTVPLIDEKISTTINPLSNKIVSDASVDDDEIYLDNKADTFSESNQDPLEFSTLHSTKSLISSPAAETIHYEHYDNSENIGYPVPNYDHYDNSENIGHPVPNYDHYDNIGYHFTNYEHHNNPENYGYDITSPSLEHVHIEGECNESHSDIKNEVFSASPTETTMVAGDIRFLDTIFLTGSGAGGLLGDDNGEINLVQEPDITSFPFQIPVRQSRRGGRMNDASFATWPAEKQSDFIQPQMVSDTPKLNSHDTSTDAVNMEDGFNNPRNNDDTMQTFLDGSSETVTAISSPSSSFVIPKKKEKKFPPRYCNHAGECNFLLNEGCITKEGHGVCDCRRSFVRHPETDICEALFILNTSLKLPGEVFHEDLRYKDSELYQNKTRDAIDTMWMVVYQDPTLEYNIADINVAGFEEGSLVVHWKLIFAVRKNMSISETVLEVDEKLKETFKNTVVIKSAPLNVENATFLSMSADINPCENKDLNYCSKDADCIRDEYRGFRCRCKEGYLDNSKNSLYPGEICVATCPLDYCGENGYCEVRLNGEIQCFCNGWYFGEKCNVSGILAISCFGGANVILIVIVLAIVFFIKRRRQRRARFYGGNQIESQQNPELGPFGRVSPRLAASIALDEMGPTKSSKFKAISTPYYITPDIHVTSPSIIGSSISYDYDSTFDRTPSAEVKMDPPKYDSTPVDIEPPKYDSTPVDIEPPKYDSTPVDIEPSKYDSTPVDIEPPKYDTVPEV